MAPTQSNRTFEMSSSGKFILCIAVLFCVLQAAVARPRLDGNFVENVRYDLLKKCAGLEKDMTKEALNVKQKLLKESTKLMKKVTKAESSDCIETSKFDAEQQLEEKSTEIQDRLEELRESFESQLQPESTLQEVMTLRSKIKDELQKCKNSGKADLKAIMNEFSAAGKRCLV